MTNQLLRFHPSLILRIPSQPFNSHFDEAFIRQCLSDAQFAEALYVASPALYEECLKWQAGAIADQKRIQKLLHSLVKYYCRTSSRSTPFGLFAGCSAADWGSHSRIRLNGAPYKRHTRLDMQYLCALAEYLAACPPVRERLRYFPNSSIYMIGDEIRYIEYRSEKNARLYQISSATASSYLLHILAASAGGRPVAEMTQSLMGLEDGLTEADCRDFVHQLIESQLLVSELEPSVTGTDFLRHILDVLGRIGTQEPGGEVTGIVARLEQVQARLRDLDASAANDPGQYEQIIERLQELEVPLVKHQLFQVDLSVLPDQPVLDEQLQAQLLEGLRVLRMLAPRHTDHSFETFKTLFTDRYGDQEVPLLNVLDTESGIGYPSHNAGIHMALIEDLVLTVEESEEHVVGHQEAQRFIYRKLLEAQKNGSYSVAIEPEEIKLFAQPGQLLPPSLPVVFRLTDAGTVLLEGAAGSSAVNLLGRFAHGNRTIAEVIGQITRAEQQANPDVILAEVNHLPQSRTGNILARPQFRAYEIPYLTYSTLPSGAQISLQDLFISLKNNRIILRSRRLNKEVIPRLGTAHNFAHQSLPVYHFLCSLQTQGLQSGLHFSWDPVPPGLVFLPRVTYNNLILHPATWHLSRQHLEELLRGDADALPDRLAAFRKTWQLPRRFTLADGDNELLVDADNLLTVKAWLETIKHYDAVKLKEFLFDPDKSLVTDAQGRPYVNQFIALLLNGQECYPGRENNVAAYAGVAEPRKFWFGSEWLYYKFYCGAKSSDRILLEGIRPLSEALMASGLIDKWFFVRFDDPNSHLRVRFHLKDAARVGEAGLMVNQYLAPYLEKELIWKSQVDTYVRELERYGYRATEMSETLFYYDSLCALAILTQTMSDEPEDTRWLWGVRSVDELLNAFHYTLPDKQLLIGRMKDAFGREFGMNKQLKLQLDARYRSNRSLMSQYLNPEGGLALTHPAIFEHLSRRNAFAGTLAGSMETPEQQQRLGVSSHDLVSSHAHMLLNRLIPAHQRLHEVVIYDFLFRQYQAQAAIQKR